MRVVDPGGVTVIIGTLYLTEFIGKWQPKSKAQDKLPTKIFLVNSINISQSQK